MGLGLRLGLRLWLGLRLGLGSAKVEILPKHNMILSTVTIKYLGIFVIKNPSSGI